jgi:hypothetical protein
MRQLRIDQTTGDFTLNKQEIGNYMEAVVKSARNHSIEGVDGMVFVLQIWHSLEHNEENLEMVEVFFSRSHVVVKLVQCIRDTLIHKFSTLRLESDGSVLYAYCIDGKMPKG